MKNPPECSPFCRYAPPLPLQPKSTLSHPFSLKEKKPSPFQKPSKPPFQAIINILAKERKKKPDWKWKRHEKEPQRPDPPVPRLPLLATILTALPLPSIYYQRTKKANSGSSRLGIFCSRYPPSLSLSSPPRRALYAVFFFSQHLRKNPVRNFEKDASSASVVEDKKQPFPSSPKDGGALPNPATKKVRCQHLIKILLPCLPLPPDPCLNRNRQYKMNNILETADDEKENENKRTKKRRPCHSNLPDEEKTTSSAKGSLLPRLQMLYAPHSKASHSLRKVVKGSQGQYKI